MAKFAVFGTDMAPVKASLRRSTENLAIYNATLTATAVAEVADEQTKMLKDQGRVLEFLVTRFLAHENGEGSRIPPAFSQMTAKDFDEEHNETWQNIDVEFKQAGIEPSVVKANRDFMKHWIETVIGEDDSTVVADDNDSTTRGLGDISNEEDGSLSNGEGASGARAQNRPVRLKSKGKQKANQPPPPPPTGPTQTPTQRSASLSTHRSQSSTWHDSPPDGAQYAVKMLAKVFRSKYGEDCDDLYILPAKRAYQLVVLPFLFPFEWLKRF